MAKAPKRPRAEPRKRKKPSWNGLKLKSWREHLEYSIEDLAAEAGVTPGLISQIENGASDGSADTLQHKILRALQKRYPKLTMGMLFDTEPTPGERYIGLWVKEENIEDVIAAANPAPSPAGSSSIRPKRQPKKSS